MFSFEDLPFFRQEKMFWKKLICNQLVKGKSVHTPKEGNEGCIDNALRFSDVLVYDDTSIPLLIQFLCIKYLSTSIILSELYY